MLAFEGHRNHGTHVVLVEGRKMVADVGFGGRAPRRPLDLSGIGQVVDDGDALDEPLRIIEAGEYGVMIQRRVAGIWSDQFSLEPIAAHAADLEVASHFQSTASSEGILFSLNPTDRFWLWKEARFSDPAGNQLCIFHAVSNRR